LYVGLHDLSVRQIDTEFLPAFTRPAIKAISGFNGNRADNSKFLSGAIYIFQLEAGPRSRFLAIR
jgi:hypothetical protein